MVNRAFGTHADADGGDDEVAVLVAVLGDGLAEDQLARPPALLLPRLAGLGGGGQYVARLDVTVVDEALLSMQAAASAATTAAAPAFAGFRTGWLAAGAEPAVAVDGRA